MTLKDFIETTDNAIQSQIDAILDNKGHTPAYAWEQIKGIARAYPRTVSEYLPKYEEADKQGYLRGKKDLQKDAKKYPDFTDGIIDALTVMDEDDLAYGMDGFTCLATIKTVEELGRYLTLGN